MPEPKPVGSSTPNYYFKPSGRRNVRSFNEDDGLYSPVTNKSGSKSPTTRSPYANRRVPSCSLSSGESSEKDSEEDLENTGSVEEGEVSLASSKRSSHYQNSHSQNSSLFNGKRLYFGCALVVIFCIALYFCVSDTEDVQKTSECDIPSSQKDDLTLALHSGIWEVNRIEKPSVFILLYKDDHERMLNEILRNYSSYASCILGNKNNIPIILNGDDMSNMGFEEYGEILEKYKGELQRKGVMIVKNLDHVSGSLAPAFHALCDEINPLVGKSVFFFTIRVEDYPEQEYKFVEKLLRGKWKNLKQDHFDPLITRITNMILQVK